ncbi:MAG: MFS transporter [Planctomycetes bacterium]|nr:MFS transporter [Planctomycetota bacterium]
MSEAEFVPVAEDAAPPRAEAARLRDVSADQWRAGVAAWLGWTFDGLDMHLYTLVALPFVAELLHASLTDDAVGRYSSWIQAAFLFGWALGGGLFGRVGDRLGRTRTLMLTILTYAVFTGLSFFAQAWWHLFIFRFLAALGIGGEWAVGASLLSETWPRRWRPWIAGVLQSGVNVGVLFASLIYFVLSLADMPNRSVFLVGVLPALLVVWIRRAVPESAEWHAARLASQTGAGSQPVVPGIRDLFRGPIRRTTMLTIAVCALSLNAHWAFMFWSLQHLRNLPDLRGRTDIGQLVSLVLTLLMLTAIVGNFLCALLARRWGYRRVIVLGCVSYFAVMAICYGVPRAHGSLWWFLAALGTCSGLFALFTMYLPPLFPTLLRTTGAGFCYNIGRVVAGFGTVFFGLFSQVGDFRLAMFYASFLFIPAAGAAWFLPELSDEAPATPQI